jgi:hypothetical protein
VPKEENMLSRRLALSAFVVATVSASVVGRLNAWEIPNRTAHLTFKMPVQLPGIGLPPGTYTFELASPQANPNIVRVLSRDRSIVYFVGFTQPVPRPDSLRSASAVIFGEAVRNVPLPIAVWFPPGDSLGREFIYGNRLRNR